MNIFDSDIIIPSFVYVHAGTVRCNGMLPQHAHAVLPVVTSADRGQTLVTKAKKNNAVY